MLQKFALSVMICLGLLACKDSKNASNSKYYQAISKGDTADLELILSEKRFFGKLTIKSRNSITKGEIEGDIIQDRLTGSFYYTPYRHKNKKRKAIAFLRQGNMVMMGHGKEYLYMGIPLFDPSSINFENPQFVFHRITD